MASPHELLADKVQDLNDLELAILLCLVAEQHCIVETNNVHINNVQEELCSIIRDTFELTCAVVECSAITTLDAFGNALLVEDDVGYFSSKLGGQDEDRISPIASSPRAKSKWASRSSITPLEKRRIPNVIIAKHLNHAQQHVQIQALELMRTKRIATRTTIYTAPKRFIFIALKSSTAETELISHLNDSFFILHQHDADEEDDNNSSIYPKNPQSPVSEDNASTSSVVHTPGLAAKSLDMLNIQQVKLNSSDIDFLIEATSTVRINVEIRAYMHHIIVFLRLHRAVASGVSALATRHFDLLARALAPLHGIAYVSPSLVALAARKVYLHRIHLTTPERERSIQWGSSLDAVRTLLDGFTVEDVIEEVLQMVEIPL